MGHYTPPDPEISCVRPPIYHTGRVWSPLRGGGTPRPDPPGRGRPPPYHTGAGFQGAGGPRSLSREFWSFGGHRAAGPPGHGVFRGNPPMVSIGGARRPGGCFWGPRGPGGVFGPIWSRRNGINFLSIFSSSEG